MDLRKFRIVSDYLGNTPELFSAAQILKYGKQCNRENKNDPEWINFLLVDLDDRIIDNSHHRGNEGHLAAVQVYPPTELAREMGLVD